MSFSHTFRMSLLAAGLALAASACGSSSSPTSPTTTAADVTISIVGNLANQSFNPNPTTMKVGQTVAFKNADSIVHDATQDASKFTTGNVQPGTTSSPIAMSTAGTFTYHCSIHPGMIGTITVQ
jgi:plastocyanin